MIEASPKVPAESQTLKIPIFLNNSSRLGSLSNRSTQSFAVSSSSSKGFPDVPRPVLHRSFTTSNLSSKCKCPHVIVADDDPFQAFYYQTLFHRSLSFETMPFKKEDFRLAIFTSGEEMLGNYRKYKACGCGSVLLVITDFNMGEKKLNGLDTVSMLAKLGHKGPTLLRTSDTLEDLSKTHKSLSTLLETKTLTSFLNKCDHLQTKDTIHSLLKIKTECT